MTAEQFIAEANALADDYVNGAIAFINAWKPKAEKFFAELEASDLPDTIKIAIVETMEKRITNARNL